MGGRKLSVAGFICHGNLTILHWEVGAAYIRREEWESMSGRKKFYCCWLQRAMIRNMMKEGTIVPPEVTIKLLLRAILESGNDKFLIDGFPRDEENRAAFESITNIEPDFVLFLDCPEEEMKRRILARNQGRVDDSIQTMRKRFRVYMDSTVPVLDHYNSKAKLRKVDASRPIDKVFEDVKVIFAPFGAKANNSMRRSSIRMGMGHKRVISLVERLCRATRDIIAYIFSKLRSFYPPACITRKALKST